jgi:nucleoside-triphosphatase THEP1
MIYLLTGPVHSGKTTFLRQVIRSLKEKGTDIGGFLSVSVWNGDERLGYDLYDLREEKLIPFIRAAGERTWQKSGPYSFIPDGLERAKSILLRTQNADLLVVDEVGPLEVSGEGLWPVLKDVVSDCRTNCLLVVRESILGDFLKILGGFDVKVFYVRDEGVFARIMDAFTAERTGRQSKQV